MPNANLQPGLVFSRSIIVDESHIGPSLSRSFTGLFEMPSVFTTAAMVGLVEWTCVEGLRPYLREGEYTVTTLIDLSHVAPAPVDACVTADVSLLAVVGRKLRFLVSCRDQREILGKGCHERTVIDSAKFACRAEAKRAHLMSSPHHQCRGQ